MKKKISLCNEWLVRSLEVQTEIIVFKEEMIHKTLDDSDVLPVFDFIIFTSYVRSSCASL